MNLNEHAKLSVAPMMDWTDRHCRYLHRMMSRNVLLYTEMVTAAAVVHGDTAKLLAFDPAEHPVAVQLGGSEPDLLAQATKACVASGYDEVNLNCGCPSDRVQSGMFGAILMAHPDLVRDCVIAMMEAAGDVPVTIKCRIGIDDQEPREVLPRFLEAVQHAGVQRVTIHARKAWLKGLSPKENRDIPPLDYDLVSEMKSEFPELWIGINGGINSLKEAKALLDTGLDGVMIGRSAYQSPSQILLTADRDLWGSAQPYADAHSVVKGILPYVDGQLSRGVKLNQMTRHMLGLFHGMPGGRHWRRILSQNAHRDGAGVEVISSALEAVEEVSREVSGSV